MRTSAWLWAVVATAGLSAAGWWASTSIVRAEQDELVAATPEHGDDCAKGITYDPTGIDKCGPPELEVEDGDEPGTASRAIVVGDTGGEDAEEPEPEAQDEAEDEAGPATAVARSERPDPVMCHCPTVSVNVVEQGEGDAEDLEPADSAEPDDDGFTVEDDGFGEDEGDDEVFVAVALNPIR